MTKVANITRKEQEQGIRHIAKTKPNRSQKNQIVRWRNTRFACCFSGLPPSPADVGYFQDLVLREADLVGVFWVRIVRVNCLGAVWVLGRLRHFARNIARVASHRTTEPGRVGVFSTRRTAGVPRHGGRCFEAVELSRSVHLGHLAGRGLGTVAVNVRHMPWVVSVSILLLVEGKRINKAAMRGLRTGTKVKDPHNLIYGQHKFGCLV